MLRLDWIDSPDAFAALAEQWDALADAERLPFLRHGWFAAWWDGFGAGRLRMPAAFRDGRLAAVFPLWRRGRRLLPLANEHSPSFRPFGERDALRLVIEAAVRAAPDLLLPAVAVDCEAHGLFLGVARERRRLVLARPHQRSPWVDTSGELDAYRAGLDRDTRKELERLRRKTEREHDAVIAVAERPVDVAGALQHALALEAAGWKGARGSAIAADSAAVRFYTGLAERFAAEGKLVLSTTLLDGTLAAFDLGLVEYDRLWILKGSYLERHRRLAPGLVLTYAQIEWAFARGLRSVELLGDATPWKLKFAARTREHEYVGSYRPTPLPVVRRAYRASARERLRRVYRVVRPAR